MKLRAIIKQEGDWWIGWLVDIPGVNAQEHTRDELLRSLRIGLEDMLTTEVQVPENSEMVPIAFGR